MILASIAVAAALSAGSPEPHDPLVRAREAYEDERFDDAARALQDAYDRDPRPKYLYARAQALRLGGDCVAAIDAYDAFLAADPPAEAAEDATQNRDRCAEQLAEARPGPPPPDPELAAAAAPATSPRDRRVRTRQARPWYADPWGGALSGIGLATAVAGAAVLADAHARAERARASPDDGAYLRALGPAPATSRVGIGLLAAGGALLTTGVIRYAVVATRRRRAVASLGLGPGSAIVHIRW